MHQDSTEECHIVKLYYSEQQRELEVRLTNIEGLRETLQQGVVRNNQIRSYLEMQISPRKNKEALENGEPVLYVSCLFFFIHHMFGQHWFL